MGRGLPCFPVAPSARCTLNMNVSLSDVLSRGGIYFCDTWSHSAADLGLFLLLFNTCRSSVRFGAGTAPQSPTRSSRGRQLGASSSRAREQSHDDIFRGSLPCLLGTFSSIAAGHGRTSQTGEFPMVLPKFSSCWSLSVPWGVPTRTCCRPAFSLLPVWWVEGRGVFQCPFI